MSYRGGKALLISLANGKFLYILLGVLLGLVVFEGLHILFLLYVLPRFGLECDSIAVSFFSFKRVNGRWRKGDSPYAPFVRYTVAAKGSPDVAASHLHFILCRLFTKAALAAVVTVLSVPAWGVTFSGPPLDEFSYDPSTDWAFFVVFFCIVSWSAVIGDIVSLINHSNGSEGTVSGYVQEIANAVRNGTSYAQLRLRPIGELPVSDLSEAETASYLTYYCKYLIDASRENALSAPVHRITDILRSQEFIQNCTEAYAMLLLYYSRYETDPEYAQKFYEKAGTALVTDTGAFSKCALAYYFHGTRHDPQKAQAFLDKTNAALGKQDVIPPAEFMLTRRLADDLAPLIGQSEYR